MHRSHTPPKWDPDGGLNSHLMLLCKRYSWIWLSFHLEIASRSSLFPPTKLEPLSDLIISGIPRLAMKRRVELTNESLSILWATSKCMALVAKHDLTWLLTPLTQNGPKQSTPKKLKGVYQVWLSQQEDRPSSELQTEHRMRWKAFPMRFETLRMRFNGTEMRCKSISKSFSKHCLCIVKHWQRV